MNLVLTDRVTVNKMLIVHFDDDDDNPFSNVTTLRTC
jgi:hypothetical protein